MTKIEFEEVDCPLCGGAKFRRLLSSRDYQYGVPGDFHIVKCVNCNLAMQNPRPTAQSLAGLYPEDYEPHTLVGRIGGEEAFIAGQQGRRMLVEKFMGRGRIVDIGSGDGRFLLCMKRAGWEVDGCELVERAAGFQRDKLGLNVRTGGLIEAGFEAGSFDAATLWSVLEHLHNPLEVLVEVRRVLKPGGLLIIGVPNFDSLERRIFQSRWFSLWLPYHLFHFTPRTLRKMIDAAGLELDKVMYATTATSVLNSARMVMRQRAGNAGAGQSGGTAPHNEKTDAAVSAVGSALKRIAFTCTLVPALRTLDALHLGATTNFIVKKPM